MEIGTDKLAAAIPGAESAIRMAAKHSYNLLTVFENELGTPGVQFFRSEILLAEDVSYAPGVKTGKDYLLNILPLMKKEGYDRFTEVKQVKIGDTTIYRVDLSKQVRSDLRAYQAYFATISQGYALSLVISTEDQGETQKLAESPGLHFGPKFKDMSITLSRPAAIPSDPRESGSIRSGLYHNNYFEMNYRVPEGWFIDTDILQKRLSETVTPESNPNKRIVTLLAANEFAPGTPGVSFDPILQITAYSALQHGRVTTPKEYLLAVTVAAKKFENAELIQKGPELIVGSQKFYRADYRRPDRGVKAVVCTAWKEHIIAWTFVGRSQTQVDDLVRSMRSVSLSAAHQ